MDNDVFEQDVYKLQARFQSKFKLTKEESWDLAVDLYMCWNKNRSVKHIPHSMFFYRYVDMIRKKRKKNSNGNKTDRQKFLESLNNHYPINDNINYETKIGKNERMIEAVDLVLEHASNCHYGRNVTMSGKQIMLSLLSGITHQDIADFLGLSKSRITQIYNKECKRIKEAETLI